MRDSWRSAWLRYGAAVAAVGLVLAIKLLLVRVVGPEEPFLLFFAAVLIAAWIGGLGPGLLATALATVCNFYFFMAPYFSFRLATREQPPQLALSILEGICISVICAKLRDARKRAETNADKARELEKLMLEISDAEQRRIGHDLHDGLGQHLTGIALLTRQLEQRLGSESSTHAERAAKIAELAKTAVEWTHDLTRALASPALERQGLAEALRELVANAETLFSITCTFTQDHEITFRDVATGVHLYRIAQEAISNAVKHGHAKKIELKLSARDTEIIMEITDDGRGIQSPGDDSDGMGMQIMRHRAHMIGATIDIHSRQGSGTTVICRYNLFTNQLPRWRAQP